MPADTIADTQLPDLKRRILAYARSPEQMAFVHVVPSETGISRTIWVSQNEAYPALIVSPWPGRLIDPPDDALVIGFDEMTPFPDVNEWLTRNRHLLPPLAKQETDIGDFYDELLKPQAS